MGGIVGLVYRAAGCPGEILITKKVAVRTSHTVRAVDAARRRRKDVN
jgi:hypothetical protein